MAEARGRARLGERQTERERHKQRSGEQAQRRNGPGEADRVSWKEKQRPLERVGNKDRKKAMGACQLRWQAELGDIIFSPVFIIEET